MTRVFTMFALSKGMGQFWHAEGRASEYTWVQNTLKQPFSRMQSAQYILSSSHINSMSESMVRGHQLTVALPPPLPPYLPACYARVHREGCGSFFLVVSSTLGTVWLSVQTTTTVRDLYETIHQVELAPDASVVRMYSRPMTLIDFTQEMLLSGA